MSYQIAWNHIINGEKILDIFIRESNLEKIAKSGNDHAKTLYEILILHANRKTATQIVNLLPPNETYSESRIYDFITEIREIYDRTQKQSKLLPRRNTKHKDVTYDDFSSYIEYTLENGYKGKVHFEDKKFNSSLECFKFVANAISDNMGENFYNMNNVEIEIKDIKFVLNKKNNG